MSDIHVRSLSSIISLIVLRTLPLSFSTVLLGHLHDDVI